MYSTKTADVDLWQSDLTHNTANDLLVQPSVKMAVNSSRMDSQPIYSKDGRSLLFMSNRNGDLQLWLKKEDGLLPIESFSNTKIDTYAWHPDGVLAVVATSDKHIYLLNTETLATELINLKGQSAAFPSFSSDGTTMYFTSDKSGDWQLWGYKLLERSIVQVSRNGAYQAKADDNNKVLYFNKYRQQGIWQLDLETAKETQLVSNVSRSLNFKVCSDSIYYSTESDNIELWRMDLKTTKNNKILTYPLNSNFKFDLADDCQKLTYSKKENIESDILMLKL